MNKDEENEMGRLLAELIATRRLVMIWHEDLYPEEPSGPVGTLARRNRWTNQRPREVIGERTGVELGGILHGLQPTPLEALRDAVNAKRKDLGEKLLTAPTDPASLPDT